MARYATPPGLQSPKPHYRPVKHLNLRHETQRPFKGVHFFVNWEEIHIVSNPALLIWFVVLYMAVSIGIGLWAATRVHNARDYAVAGRRMPFILVTSTVFATWFGAEAVLEPNGSETIPPRPSPRNVAGIPSTASAPNHVANTVDVTRINGMRRPATA